MKRILKWLIRIVLILLVLLFLFVFVAYWRSTNDCDKKNAAAPTNPMKAIVRCDYGLSNLRLEDIEKPAPDNDQILVKVHAVSVNPYDWHFVEGTIFAFGSAIYSALFLRGRLIPTWLARLGVFASILLIAIIPFGATQFISSGIANLAWLPMLIFEVTLGCWLLFTGARKPIAAIAT